MNKKEFENLPEKPVDIEGVIKPRPAKEHLPDYYKTLGNGTQEYLGIQTHIASLDKATLGLDGLIVLGGIAGRGKTSFALQIACNASDKGTPTLFYSLEMPKRAVFTKILNRYSKVKYSDILLKGRPYLSPEGQDETGDFQSSFSKDDIERLKTGQANLAKIGDKFYLRTRERGEAEINFETVEQEINLIQAEHNADKVLVVIDHLQVFSVEGYKDQIDKENKLITGFKGISERTGASIILISQKNKAGFESRGGLQSIKGSVDIVYLADVVMFLEGDDEREQAGQDETIARAKATFGGGQPTNTDLIIAKNRYNAPTTLKFAFIGENSEFVELDR